MACWLVIIEQNIADVARSPTCANEVMAAGDSSRSPLLTSIKADKKGLF